MFGDSHLQNEFVQLADLEIDLDEYILIRLWFRLNTFVLIEQPQAAW
jgi:hypothetical protein